MAGVERIEQRPRLDAAHFPQDDPVATAVVHLRTQVRPLHLAQRKVM
jgi:hypothetical protein